MGEWGQRWYGPWQEAPWGAGLLHSETSQGWGEIGHGSLSRCRGRMRAADTEILTRPYRGRKAGTMAAGTGPGPERKNKVRIEELEAPGETALTEAEAEQVE